MHFIEICCRILGLTESGILALWNELIAEKVHQNNLARVKNDCAPLNIKIFIGLFIVYILLIPGYWLIYFVEINFYCKKNTKEFNELRIRNTSVSDLKNQAIFIYNTSYIPNHLATRFNYYPDINSQFDSVERRVSRKYQMWQDLNEKKKSRFNHL